MRKLRLTSTASAVLVALLTVSAANAAITNNYIGREDAVITEELAISAPLGMITVGTEHGKYGIYGNGKNLKFVGSNNTISIDARNLRFEAYPSEDPVVLGVESNAGTNISIGNKNSISSFDFKSNSWIIGLRAAGSGTPTDQGGSLTLSGNTINISAESFGTSDDDTVYALIAQNFTTTASENLRAKVVINAENTNIIAKSAAKGNASGLVLMSQGIMEINSNLLVKADNAIVARGGSILRINEDGKHTTKLFGDINFNYDKKTSGTVADADVVINLAGSDSIWEGNSFTSYSGGKPTAEGYLDVTGLQVSLTNGATWKPSVIENYDNGNEGKTYVPLNQLTLDDGVIDIQNSSQTVQVQNLAGTGGTINVAAAAENGAITKVGTFSVSKVTEDNVALNVNATGINADEINDAEAAMSAMRDAVQVTDSDSNTNTPSVTNTISEGAVKGAISQIVNADGTTTAVTQTENTKLTAFNSVSAMATMAWRHDMNDLTKRMGELRDSPEGIGSWVRFYGSEQEYGRQNMTSKSTSVQLGSDYDIGSGWKVGGAFTYTDGTAKYDNGSSDNKAYGVAAYGSWLADNGAFVDLIGKYSRLSSDFELSSMDGKSKNNALSASVEAGWHIPFAELAFVEPQAELTYGVVLGDDFTTSNGVKISQEDTEALIGRLGVRTGFHFPNKKGTVYARASVLHDFKGESEFTASLVDDASVRSTMKDDIGGTYYEIGVGANFNWTDNAYSYVDLEKQNGGDVKENWRWNVGFRYVW